VLYAGEGAHRKEAEAKREEEAKRGRASRAAAEQMSAQQKGHRRSSHAQQKVQDEIKLLEQKLGHQATRTRMGMGRRREAQDAATAAAVLQEQNTAYEKQVRSMGYSEPDPTAQPTPRPTLPTPQPTPRPTLPTPQPTPQPKVRSLAQVQAEVAELVAKAVAWKQQHGQ
jgi:hypothetical protein